MAKNTDNKDQTTAADVVAEAEKANLLKDTTIPAQTVPEAEQDSGVTSEDQTDEQSEGKVSLKDRLKNVGEKVKANKKSIAITVGVVGAAALVFVKVAAISAAKTVVEEVMDASEKAFEEATADNEQNAEAWTDKDETDLEQKVTETKSKKAKPVEG